MEIETSLIPFKTLPESTQGRPCAQISCSGKHGFIVGWSDIGTKIRNREAYSFPKSTNLSPSAAFLISADKKEVLKTEYFKLVANEGDFERKQKIPSDALALYGTKSPILYND